MDEAPQVDSLKLKIQIYSSMLGILFFFLYGVLFEYVSIFVIFFLPIFIPFFSLILIMPYLVLVLEPILKLIDKYCEKFKLFYSIFASLFASALVCTLFLLFLVGRMDERIVIDLKRIFSVYLSLIISSVTYTVWRSLSLNSGSNKVS